MKNFAIRLFSFLLLVAAAVQLCLAQGGTAPSLSGSVVDQAGKAVPGAQIRIINESTSAEYQAVAARNGTFFIPALTSGTYAANGSAAGFKQAVVKAIKIDAGVPATLRIILEAGSAGESVIVDAGAGVVQAQSADVTETMTAGQISGLPLASRNTTDLLVLLPGVNTTAGPRVSTFTGLPSAAINITIDGINSQDNYSKSGDGFFSAINPRLDAVGEVVVSLAAPGAGSAGQGAVQVRFITRSGSSTFHGSLYEYHRNSALNANYWFNNRDLTPPAGVTWTPDWKAPNARLLLNQFGGRAGGPITLPKALFGPLGFDGRDRAFFFVNYEEFRQPSERTRYNTIFSPLAEQGIFQYSASLSTRQVDLLRLASSNGQTATMDPTIQKLLADIRHSTAAGSVKAQMDPNYQSFMFTNRGLELWRFPTARLDFNLTSRHRLEGSWNFSQHVPGVDMRNGLDPAYPGFPNFGTQGSNNFTGSVVLRSTLSTRLVNELRGGLSGGTTLIDANVDAGTLGGPVGNQDGFALNLSTAGISNAYVIRTAGRRNSPVQTIEDTLNWTHGSHGFSFGGSFTNVSMWTWDQFVAPAISFGLDSAPDPAAFMFSATNGMMNFPGASSSTISKARDMYAVLTGRVTGISGVGFLNENTNRYEYNGPHVERARQREAGMFVSDSWRLRPGLTLNIGLRWEVQWPFAALNNMYSTATIADLWGVSGTGNLFKPGTITGAAPQFVQYQAGGPAYGTDYKVLAPSFGFAWSPSVHGGVFHRLLGSAGQSVFRGGYAISSYRYGMSDYSSVFSGNPGATVNAMRGVASGNLAGTSETGSYPVLFREKSRLGPPSIPESPAYPLAPSFYDSINVFDPNLRMPYVQSWMFGIQRELTRNTAVELRYVATRNLQPWTAINLNEVNIIENGFLDELKNAMANFQANMAAGRGANFRYYGPGTNTNPLPITLAYLSGIPKSQADDATKYTSFSFSSSTFINTLARTNPNPYAYQQNLSNNSMSRTYALNAGLPANLFVVNPAVASGGAWIETNGGFDRYDGLMVELRRRMARDLLVQANYTFSKSFSGDRYSFRTPWVKTLGTMLPHAFKVNWIYEMPVGRGKALAPEAYGLIESLIGGWEFHGAGRWQSGNLLDFGNYRLVGMTMRELQDAVGLRFDDVNKRVYYVPQDIINNTYMAFSTSATSTTGYNSGVLTGRYFAPANSGGCIQVVEGDCAPQNIFVRGPRFMRFDLGVVKRLRFSESKNLELRGEFLNAFNRANFYGATCVGGSLSCGMVTSAYTDLVQTQDPGGRQIQLVVRFNF